MGLTTYPPAADNVFLQLIALREPVVFRALMHGYAALWFSTPFFAASLVSVDRWRSWRIDMPADAANARAPAVSETGDAPGANPGPWRDAFPHDAWAARRSPTWLTIPQRGLYTGVMILGAVGTGKTSACMYPYVDQLLRWRARIRTQRSAAWSSK